MLSLKRLLGGLTALGVAITACNDNSGSGPPAGPTPTFANMQAVFQTDCITCHGAQSGRLFTVDIDSSSLVASGFINPAQPDASLILLKPQNLVPHGGGAVAGFTSAEVAMIRDWIGAQPVASVNTLTAIRTALLAPLIDGYASDMVWFRASAAVVPVSGGWADAREVVMKAAYDSTYLYLFLRWYDDAESVLRQPWVKQADGSWRTVAAKPTPVAGIDWATYMGANFDEESGAYMYEDKLAVMWNTYGATTVAGFDQSGCAVLCHDPGNNFSPGTTYNYTDQNLAAKKYTNTLGEIADMWHWKLVRNNQHSKVDDQNVRFWQQGTGNPAEGGRASDVGAGGYGSNPATGGGPTYRGPSLTAPPFYILDAQKIAVTQAELDALPVGAMIPNMITSGPTGTRADIDGRAIFNPADKSWTLEIRRRLVTGDTLDVQFDDLTRKYAFGVAVFDNAQIEHSWSPLPFRLEFKP